MVVVKVLFYCQKQDEKLLVMPDTMVGVGVNMMQVQRVLFVQNNNNNNQNDKCLQFVTKIKYNPNPL